MLNKKGFTVIELITSFAFVGILSASLFAAVLNYKEKEQTSMIRAQLFAFKSTLVEEIQMDISKKLLNNITYCRTSSGSIENRCVVINFMDGSSKRLEIKEEKIEKTIENSTFTYTVPYITYGGIRYTPPDPGKVYINDDYLLQYTSESDDIENGLAIYKINIDFRHIDIEGDMDLSIVATGNKLPANSPTYNAYNVGDKVSVLVNGTTNVNFYVIKKSGVYDSHVTLLLDSSNSLPKVNGAFAVQQRLSYSGLNVGNDYESSLVKSQIDTLYRYWSTPDVIRLITAEELGYLVYACPKYVEVNAPNLSLASAPSWVYDTSYWTMSPKLYSTADNGKKVWVVSSSSRELASDYVNSVYDLRPVIEVNKLYVNGLAS